MYRLLSNRAKQHRKNDPQKMRQYPCVQQKMTTGNISITETHDAKVIAFGM